jgi:hypothetical protein
LERSQQAGGGEMTLFEVSYVALWIIVVVLGIAVYALYYHFGEMYLTSAEGRASQGPRVGERLRSVHANPLDGPTIELPRPSQRTILLFTAPACAVCSALFAELAALSDSGFLQDVLVVTSGSTDDAMKWQSILPLTRIVIDSRASLRARYGIGVTPFGVATDASGHVRTRGVVSNADNLRGLIVQARIDEQSIVTPLRAGDPGFAAS